MSSDGRWKCFGCHAPLVSVSFRADSRGYLDPIPPSSRLNYYATAPKSGMNEQIQLELQLPLSPLQAFPFLLPALLFAIDCSHPRPPIIVTQTIDYYWLLFLFCQMHTSAMVVLEAPKPEGWTLYQVSFANGSEQISGCLDYRLQRTVPLGVFYHTENCEICLCSSENRMCKQVTVPCHIFV